MARSILILRLARFTAWLVPFAFVCLPATATLRNVPGQYATIQSALDQSVTGDTVLVAPGTYAEAIRFPAVDVKLLSQYAFTQDSASIYLTTIDAEPFADDDTSAVLTFAQPNTREAEVAGFTLRGGHGTMHEGTKGGGAVYLNGSSPSIVGNIVTENHADHPAVFCANGSPLVSHNVIGGNICIGPGLVRFVGNAYPDTVDFEWNDIRQNVADQMAVVSAGYSMLRFRFNRFHDYHYPILMTVRILNSSATFQGNVFENLSGDTSFGWSLLYLDQHVDPIEDNVFSNCVITGSFPIVLARQGLFPTQEISRNLFENVAVTDSIGGSGFFIQNPSVHLHDNAFINGRGGLGGVYLTSSATCGAEIVRNYFYGNRGNEFMGAAAVFKLLHASCVLTDNWFEDNGPEAVGQDVGSETWDITGNYWGDPSGPFHAVENPSGQGDTVDATCHVTPWLTEPPNLSTASPRHGAETAEKWQLDPVYPNPFNATLNVHLTGFAVPVRASVRIYNLQGQRVRDLWRGVIPRYGDVRLSWDGRGSDKELASGLYLIVASTPANTVRTQKAILLR